ncbi:MAG: WecB/TagA/CpsF family glycosyltransferase [Actinobacteria bacterium]|nr:WecB/TagA/CpsF family glycosyltransferase [Actinomycetota bacterium]
MAPDGTSSLRATSAVVRVAGLDLHPLSEEQVVAQVIRDLKDGQGGWVVPANIDVCRQSSRDHAARELVSGASLVVADGMPLVWAARLHGEPVPERVTGASLIFTLTAAAAEHGKSVYLLGGKPGVPERAAAELARRYPGLLVAGTDAPPVGFDRRPGEFAAVCAKVEEARPDIVYVGLGFPKQERVIAALAPCHPAAWFIGCGAAIPFAAGALPRAPRWMQQIGLEWLYRLICEPRRLFRRYVLIDFPYAISLLITSALTRFRPGVRAIISQREDVS